MNDNRLIKPQTEAIIWYIVFFIIFACLQKTARFYLLYMEQWQTFYYNSLFINFVSLKSDSIAYFLGDFLINFFCVTYCRTLVLALLFTTTACLISRIIYYFTPKLPLIFLAIKLHFLSYDDGLMYRNDIETDLKHIIDKNHKHSTTIQGRGAISLIKHDIVGFESMVDKCYKKKAFIIV